MTKYLHQGKSAWEFRRRVPLSMVEAVGRKFWVIKIGDVARREATSKAIQLTHETDRLINLARTDPEGFDKLINITDRLGVDLKEAPTAIDDQLEGSRRNRERMKSVAERAIEDLGIPFREAARLMDHAEQIFDKGHERDTANAKAEKSTLERLAGVKRTITGQTNEGCLSGLFERWRATSGARETSIYEAENIVNRFIGIFGDMPAQEIRKDHVRKFRDIVEKLPRRAPNALRGMAADKVAELTPQDGSVRLVSSTTVKKNIQWISTMLQIAEDDDLIESNPAKSVKVRGNTSVKRLPFDESHLRKMFSTPPFTPDGERSEMFWITMIAYMTGARMAEICYLQTDDIRTENGVTFFDFIDDPESGRSLKTESSRRRVPVHPQLVELGFLDYVNARPAGRIFDLKLDAKGRIAGLFQKRFGHWLRNKAKITDERVTFHSFRHLFKDLCRDAGLDEEIHDALTGHTSASVGRGYGRGASLKRLADDLSVVIFAIVP